VIKFSFYTNVGFNILVKEVYGQAFQVCDLFGEEMKADSAVPCRGVFQAGSER